MNSSYLSYPQPRRETSVSEYMRMLSGEQDLFRRQEAYNRSISQPRDPRAAYRAGSPLELQYESMLTEREPLLRSAALRGFGPSSGAGVPRIASKMASEVEKENINRYRREREMQEIRQAQAEQEAKARGGSSRVSAVQGASVLRQPVGERVWENKADQALYDARIATARLYTSNPKLYNLLRQFGVL
jgi:hypothetical protein